MQMEDEAQTIRQAPTWANYQGQMRDTRQVSESWRVLEESKLLNRRGLKGIEWDVHPNRSMADSPIGWGIYLTGQIVQKTFLDENAPISCLLLYCLSG